MGRTFVGEFEQMVLLAMLRLRDEAYAPGVRAELESCGRAVTRGALYRTFDRLESKGYVEWEVESTTIPERGGHPMRRFRVTEGGIEALRQSRTTLLKLWDGIEALIK